MIGSSQVLALLIALPVGVYAAVRPYSLFDQIASTLAFIGFSLPTFFTGLLLILLFAIQLDWLPFVYRADIAATGWRWYWEQFKQSIMPITVLGLFQGASWTRYVRSAVLDVIRLDYVTTARAKGLGERVVIIKHVVRNALIPVVTLVALQMPAVFGGAIVTEQIFRIPGIGSLLISAILRNDTPVIMAVTFVFACLVVLFNLIADVLYGWLDPRISLPADVAAHRYGALGDGTSRCGRARLAVGCRGVAALPAPPAGAREPGGAGADGAGGAVRAVGLEGGDQRHRFHRAAAEPVVGASVGHRRPRPGPARAHALRRPHLAGGRAGRDAGGDLRRRRRSARSPACRAAGSMPALMWLTDLFLSLPQLPLLLLVIYLFRER